MAAIFGQEDSGVSMMASPQIHPYEWLKAMSLARKMRFSSKKKGSDLNLLKMFIGIGEAVMDPLRNGH